ncbi:STAS domain-containing protein [Siminovitchia acidinfaciens]|uniref:STAS domain-containing protein n=1 Tax=Siminovitchia acidinfaciens TaxID=2321395 RepID=A0A429XW74_9BACI|nr:STAS domain-containing protein [Siminovitchia acidinfaciens]RST72599.1 STAS domain-containing protein [Siminovitchia acidinfaciens]
MDIVYSSEMDMRTFFKQNKDSFEERLLREAVNVRNKIEDIRVIGNINLLDNAHLLVMYVIEGREQELVDFAVQEGKAWARFSLTLAFKLEWVQAIRRTLWTYLHHYDIKSSQPEQMERFYSLEKAINQRVDQFLNTFFLSYSKYKDELLDAQREIVENLSVPIIPLNSTICVLPLIGEIDEARALIIEEKILMEISKFGIQTLMIDLSGVAKMEPEVIDRFMKIIDGIELMGCEAILTGLHPIIVRKMINLGVSFGDKAVMKGTLQQAVKDYLT